MTFLWGLLCTVAVQSAVGPPSLELERIPRLPDKADVLLWHRVVSSPPVFGQNRRSLFVRATSTDGQKALRQLGLELPAGQWVPASFSTEEMRLALDAPGVQLQLARAHRPLLDLSVGEIRAERVHQGVDLARTGRGVLVGLIDTGIDLSHKAFRTPDGKSRVVAVWDQDAADGPSPPRFGYGRECDLWEITGDRCDIGDDVGHGTHVAGIATGSGNPIGVAPAALIAVVRSDTFTRLADAVTYLSDMADRLGLPLVINISVGGQYGAHDGHTPLETFLDQHLGPGRLVVAAAGNDGNSRIHLQTELGPTPVRASLDGVVLGQSVETIVDLWSDHQTDLALSLELWQDGKPAVTVALEAADWELLTGDLTVGAQRLGSVSYGVEVDHDHALVHRVVIVDGAGGHPLPSGAQLALRLSGRGTINAWVSQTDYRFGVAQFASASSEGWVAGDNNLSLVVPATCRSVITVGAYTIRDHWRAEDASVHFLDHAEIGVLASFSSRGPTLAPAFTGTKPDLVAPGSVIVSARAASVPPGPMTLDPHRLVMQGTSMAAPHVAGVVALMLEADSELDPERVRRILSRSARVDGNTGQVPNSEWGYGKVDADAAVRLAEQESRGCAAAGGSPWGVLLLLWMVLEWRRRP